MTTEVVRLPAIEVATARESQNSPLSREVLKAALIAATAEATKWLVGTLLAAT